MANTELIECVENPLVREFLHEHLEEFVGDALFFSEHILAYVPPDGKSFIKNVGLAFYGTPIFSFVPDLPWQTIKTAIAKAVSEVFHTKPREHDASESRLSDALQRRSAERGLVKEALVAAFASACQSAEGAMGAILIGGVAHHLGKYVALCVAGTLDEVTKYRSWPIVQVPTVGSPRAKPPDKPVDDDDIKSAK
jgi:hypothetical protein